MWHASLPLWVVEGIRRALKHMSVKINFEYAKPNPRKSKTFMQQPGQMSTKECDERSKAKRKALKSSMEK